MARNPFGPHPARPFYGGGNFPGPYWQDGGGPGFGPRFPPHMAGNNISGGRVGARLPRLELAFADHFFVKINVLEEEWYNFYTHFYHFYPGAHMF